MKAGKIVIVPLLLICFGGSSMIYGYGIAVRDWVDTVEDAIKESEIYTQMGHVVATIVSIATLWKQTYEQVQPFIELYSAIKRIKNYQGCRAADTFAMFFTETKDFRNWLDIMDGRMKIEFWPDGMVDGEPGKVLELSFSDIAYRWAWDPTRYWSSSQWPGRYNWDLDTDGLTKFTLSTPAFERAREVEKFMALMKTRAIVQSGTAAMVGTLSEKDAEARRNLNLWAGMDKYAPQAPLDVMKGELQMANEELTRQIEMLRAQIDTEATKRAILANYCGVAWGDLTVFTDRMKEELKNDPKESVSLGPQ